MEQVILGRILLNLVAPVYPKVDHCRGLYPLKVCVMQNWIGLSHLTMEDALHEIASMRQAEGLSLTKPIPPDETSALINLAA